MTKRFCFTAEITLVVDGSGATQNFYFATEGFATKAADTPSNTVIRELLLDPGSIRRELFSGARLVGENRPSFGQLVLINASGILDDWIGYGVSGAKVVVRYGEAGAAYPAAFTTVYVSYAYSLIVDFDQVRVLLRDRLYLLDRPVVQSVFTGAGNLEGTGIATGTKQIVFGRPGYIPPKLIDQNRQIYFVHANASDERAFVVVGQRYLVYDGGVPLSHEGYATSEAEFLATVPSPGYFTIYAPGAVPPTPSTPGPIYVRLGSPAAFDLRIAPIGLLQNVSYESPRAWTFRDMCSRAGAGASLAAGSYEKQVGNYLVDADQTYLQVMSDACQSTLTAYGFDSQDDFFTIDLQDPSEGSDGPIYTFTVHNSKSLTRQPVPGQEAPVWQVQVVSGRTWPGSTATSLTAEQKDTFTRQPWQNAFTGTSAPVKTANPGSEVAQVEIIGRDVDSDAARLAFVRRYIYLFGSRRDLLTLTTPFSPEVLSIGLHAKVSVKMPRLGCAAGRLFRVITQSLNLRDRTVTFGLWGGDPGPSDAALTGGTTTPGGSDPTDPLIPGNVTLSNFIQRAWGSVSGGGGGGTATLAEFTQLAYGTVAASEPLFSEVVLQLHGEGADGGSVFTESSSYSRSMTVRDTVTTSTTSPAVGSASIRSHSVASALWVVADASLRTTTTPMMLDFRLKFDAGGYATNGNNEIMSQLASNGDFEWIAVISVGAAQDLRFYWKEGGGVQHQAVSQDLSLLGVNLEAWNAFRVVAIPGDKVYLFCNGALLSYAPSTNGDMGTMRTLGSSSLGAPGQRYFDSNWFGRVDEIRIAIGASVAR